MVQKFLQEFLQGHWYKILPGGRKQQGVPQGAVKHHHSLNDWQQLQQLQQPRHPEQLI